MRQLSTALMLVIGGALAIAQQPALRVVVIEGEQHVAGKVLKKGDFHYAPPNTPHGPFAYPKGGIVFAVYRFPTAAAQ